MRYLNFSTITQYLTILAFLVLITLSPSIHFIRYITFHDCQRVLQLILLSLILINASTTIASPHRLLPINKNFRIAFYTLLVLAIVSSFNAIAPRQAIIEASIFAALCYLALFVAHLYQEDKEQLIKRLTYMLWVSILLYILSFYVGYITAMIFKKPLVWPHPLYGFSNVRLFQQYQLWGLGLICLPLLAFNLNQKTRMWLYFALTSWWVLLYYAASRGIVLGWIVAMITTAIIYQKAAWPFLRIQFINAMTGLAAYYVLFKLIPVWIAASTASMTDNAITTSTVFRTMTTDRIDLWKVSLVMIDNFPLLGVGPMHFYWYNKFGTHPHNSILQLAAEFGLPATFIILTISIVGFYFWFKHFNKHGLQGASKLQTNFSIILFFTVIANGAYSLVEGVIVMPISQVLMFTVIGLMIGQYTEGAWYKSKNSTIKTKLRFRPVFAIIVLVAMISSTLPELVRGLTSDQRPVRANERAFSLAPDTIIPRIWVQQRRIENSQ